MWFITCFVMCIFGIFTESVETMHTFLIAAGLFAIAGEFGSLSKHIKKFLDGFKMVVRKEDSDHDGEV